MTLNDMIKKFESGHEKSILMNWQGYQVAEILRAVQHLIEVTQPSEKIDGVDQLRRLISDIEDQGESE